jgi:hypothetical protein
MMKTTLTLLLLVLLCSCNKEWTAEPATPYWNVVLEYSSSIKKTATTISWNDTAGYHEELLPANTTGEYRVWKKQLVCREFDTIAVHLSHAPTISIDSGYTLTIYLPMKSGRMYKLGQFQAICGPIYNAELVRQLPSASIYHTN